MGNLECDLCISEWLLTLHILKKVKELGTLKFASLFKNSISKNHADRIEADRTCHICISQNEYIFLVLIICIHILNQNHIQVLFPAAVSFPLLLLAGPDPAAPSMAGATSSLCFQASLLSFHAKHYSQEDTHMSVACVCCHTHTPENIY